MTPIDILPQQGRENPEPVEQSNPVPWWVLALVVLMMSIGIVYIVDADIETPARWGDGRQQSELSGPKKSGAAKVDGGALFASLCVACHQASGQGLPGVFPPLAGSEWVKGKDSTVAAIVLHGITGSITVKGTVYNGSMPTFKDQLSDAQIAAVLSHIRSQWGNDAPPVTEQTVGQARETNKARTTPFAGDKDLPPHD
ncbi:c-type cytochrome [Paucibacter sp. R3-3]|uniref:C-type cytochrome n=1 Tax=Roseateles agri TaxID=3098619 RepID=A0ABU5DRU8_9BURK|nr:c-type cytochrome [Paucibacter sp. R3-3]MDY0749051.1 c-type cytochrome [Paucibacter sp. R3-3]